MKRIILLLLTIYISSLVSSTNISINSLGYERYACDLCFHNGNCSYYNNCSNMNLNVSKDYIIKIIPKRIEHSDFSGAKNELYKSILPFAYFIMLLFLFGLLIRGVKNA